MNDDVRNIPAFSIAFIIIGALFGAAFASGQEMLKFFQTVKVGDRHVEPVIELLIDGCDLHGLLDLEIRNGAPEKIFYCFITSDVVHFRFIKNAEPYLFSGGIAVKMIVKRRQECAEKLLVFLRENTVFFILPHRETDRTVVETQIIVDYAPVLTRDHQSEVRIIFEKVQHSAVVSVER